MNTVQLFAVEQGGLRPLPVPQNVTRFDQLYDGLELGVYSALRTFEHNKFLCLEHHIQRTQRSAALLGWVDELDEALLRQGLHEACTQYPLPDARVRFDFLAEPAELLGTSSRMLIALIPLSVPTPELYEQGVRAAFAPDLARHTPLAKTADFAKTRSRYQVGGEIYDFLLLNEQGEILEGTGTNFYGVLNGVFYTAGEGVLAGVTRQIILVLAEQLKIPICLKPISVAQISQLSEAALSSSSRALLPVVQIGDQVVGNGRPGPICQQILAAYNEFVAREVKTAV
ncbi:aminotransferase class IV [Candidatus Leptofilum sp.]|uniref:aminotransferase class IV n=1 Tax=Candidatus Leptofilum sp. TaxID=3241576 RepID=UPI003B5A814A